ncbi:MAG: hypothetical protein CVT59_03385 [Actinobacteria bacterium HGW-Actinobacteria-1]|jgi:hypothetical protein|nr:MAG: hypothetical protein CVT59_03385 [Actinobacteria bacterium HGW-Actinobacteria-1]
MEIFGIAFGLSVAVFTVAIALLSLALPVLWVWMLIDSIAREEWEYPGGTPTSNNRLVWALLIAFLQFPAVLYFFMVYGKVKRGTVVRPAWAYQPVPVAPAA